jgi:cbb3-type cytochrome oxidase subunit 3
MAIGGAVFLVTEVLFSTAAALGVAALGLTFVAFTWFAVPEIGKKK